MVAFNMTLRERIRFGKIKDDNLHHIALGPFVEFHYQYHQLPKLALK